MVLCDLLRAQNGRAWRPTVVIYFSLQVGFKTIDDVCGGVLLSSEIGICVNFLIAESRGENN